MTCAILGGAGAAGAKLAFADNLYVYGPPDGPMTETTPQRSKGVKGRVRIEMPPLSSRPTLTADSDAPSVAPPTTTTRAKDLWLLLRTLPTVDARRGAAAVVDPLLADLS
jgi:hypothetical protein